LPCPALELCPPVAHTNAVVLPAAGVLPLALAPPCGCSCRVCDRTTSNSFLIILRLSRSGPSSSLKVGDWKMYLPTLTTADASGC
jgi:hypothetical protein